MSYHVYAIKSGDEVYIGATANLKDRIARHNAGQNKSTKHVMGWKLVYFEACKTLSEARRKEAAIKRNKVKILL